MPPVIHATREDLEAQRTALLQRVRLSYEELRDRAESYSLSADELDAWHTIQGIDYLLNGD